MKKKIKLFGKIKKNDIFGQKTKKINYIDKNWKTNFLDKNRKKIVFRQKSKTKLTILTKVENKVN